MAQQPAVDHALQLAVFVEYRLVDAAVATGELLNGLFALAHGLFDFCWNLQGVILEALG
ncbi:hypothetical protein D9M71_477460 [compost metagenome]